MYLYACMVYGYLISTLRYKLIVDFVSDSMKQLRAMQATFPYFTNPDLAYYDMHARKATTTKFAAKYPSGSWEFGVASIFHDAHNQLGMSLSVCILPPNIYIYIYIYQYPCSSFCNCIFPSRIKYSHICDWLSKGIMITRPDSQYLHNIMLT